MVRFCLSHTRNNWTNTHCACQRSLDHPQLENFSLECTALLSLVWSVYHSIARVVVVVCDDYNWPWDYWNVFRMDFNDTDLLWVFCCPIYVTTRIGLLGSRSTQLNSSGVVEGGMMIDDRTESLVSIAHNERRGNTNEIYFDSSNYVRPWSLC